MAYSAIQVAYRLATESRLPWSTLPFDDLCSRLRLDGADGLATRLAETFPRRDPEELAPKFDPAGGVTSGSRTREPWWHVGPDGSIRVESESLSTAKDGPGHGLYCVIGPMADDMACMPDMQFSYSGGVRQHHVIEVANFLLAAAGPAMFSIPREGSLPPFRLHVGTMIWKELIISGALNTKAEAPGPIYFPMKNRAFEKPKSKPDLRVVRGGEG